MSLGGRVLGGAMASGMADYLVLWKPQWEASLGRPHWEKLGELLGVV